MAICYVREKDEKICLEAVNKCGDAIKFIDNQTIDVCKEAVKQNPDVLKYVNTEFKDDCKRYLSEYQDNSQTATNNATVKQTIEESSPEIEELWDKLPPSLKVGYTGNKEDRLRELGMLE